MDVCKDCFHFCTCMYCCVRACLNRPTLCENASNLWRACVCGCVCMQSVEWVKHLSRTVPIASDPTYSITIWWFWPCTNQSLLLFQSNITPQTQMQARGQTHPCAREILACRLRARCSPWYSRPRDSLRIVSNRLRLGSTHRRACGGGQRSPFSHPCVSSSMMTWRSPKTTPRQKKQRLHLLPQS